MAKKAPTAYPSLTVTPAALLAPAGAAAADQQSARPPRMRDRADQVVLYLDPAGHKELKRFAIGADRKVHDLLLEAVEEWAAKRGIREQMRVRP
jgi:hypothetical protein